MGFDELMRDRARKSWLILWVSVTLVLVLLATALLFLLVVNKFTVEIQMNGDASVTLEYGDPYEDPGAMAVLRGSMAFMEGVELDVQTRGKVPALMLGEYTITYTASFGPWSGSATRTVTVVDTKAPEITLFSNGKLTQLGQNYREEGFIAVDNYDGDITDQVQVTESEGEMIYTVADSSGNTVTVTRQIRYAGAE